MISVPFTHSKAIAPAVTLASVRLTSFLLGLLGCLCAGVAVQPREACKRDFRQAHAGQNIRPEKIWSWMVGSGEYMAIRPHDFLFLLSKRKLVSGNRQSGKRQHLHHELCLCELQEIWKISWSKSLKRNLKDFLIQIFEKKFDRFLGTNPEKEIWQISWYKFWRFLACELPWIEAALMLLFLYPDLASDVASFLSKALWARAACVICACKHLERKTLQVWGLHRERLQGILLTICASKYVNVNPLQVRGGQQGRNAEKKGKRKRTDDDKKEDGAASGIGFHWDKGRSVSGSGCGVQVLQVQEIDLCVLRNVIGMQARQCESRNIDESMLECDRHAVKAMWITKCWCIDVGMWLACGQGYEFCEKLMHRCWNVIGIRAGLCIVWNADESMLECDWHAGRAMYFAKSWWIGVGMKPCQRYVFIEMCGSDACRKISDIWYFILYSLSHSWCHWTDTLFPWTDVPNLTLCVSQFICDNFCPTVNVSWHFMFDSWWSIKDYEMSDTLYLNGSVSAKWFDWDTSKAIHFMSESSTWHGVVSRKGFHWDTIQAMHFGDMLWASTLVWGCIWVLGQDFRPITIQHIFIDDQNGADQVLCIWKKRSWMCVWLTDLWKTFVDVRLVNWFVCVNYIRRWGSVWSASCASQRPHACDMHAIRDRPARSMSESKLTHTCDAYADEDLVDQLDVQINPQLSTVTYLTVGRPP